MEKKFSAKKNFSFSNEATFYVNQAMEVRLPQFFIILLSVKICVSIHINCAISNSQLDYLIDGFECQISNDLNILKRNLVIESISGEYIENHEDYLVYHSVEFENQNVNKKVGNEEIQADNIENNLEVQKSFEQIELVKIFENDEIFEQELAKNDSLYKELFGDEILEKNSENFSNETTGSEDLTDGLDNSTMDDEKVENSANYLEENFYSTNFNNLSSNLNNLINLTTYLTNLATDFTNFTTDSTNLTTVLSSKLPIIAPNFTITCSSINSLVTYNNTILFIPRGINDFFKNLKLLAIVSSKLTEIRQIDVKEFPGLEGLWLPYNQIEVLEWRLFDFNPNLKQLILMENRIKNIHCSAFAATKKLEHLDLIGNVCVDEFAFTVEDVKKNILDNLSKTCEYEVEYENYFVIFMALIALLCIIIAMYVCFSKSEE